MKRICSSVRNASAERGFTNANSLHPIWHNVKYCKVWELGFGVGQQQQQIRNIIVVVQKKKIKIEKKRGKKNEHRREFHISCMYTRCAKATVVVVTRF